MKKLVLTLLATSSILYILIIAILLALLTLTYKSLSHEKIIASLVFEKISGNSYQTHIYNEQGVKIGDYIIDGDQWRIDADFVKLKYWAYLLGMESKYSLNRLEGRYIDVRSENNSKHRAYQLSGAKLVRYFNIFLDVSYGSSVYKSIKTNVKFNVLKTPTGLMVREYSTSHGDIINSDKWLDKSKKAVNNIQDSILKFIE